jgi:hypothetical protein
MSQVVFSAQATDKGASLCIKGKVYQLRNSISPIKSTNAVYALRKNDIGPAGWLLYFLVRTRATRSIGVNDIHAESIPGVAES